MKKRNTLAVAAIACLLAARSLNGFRIQDTHSRQFLSCDR
jgi:hypothetical protein